MGLISSIEIITLLHHDGKELDDDIGARPNEDLALAALLCVVDRVEGRSQHVGTYHFDDCKAR